MIRVRTGQRWKREGAARPQDALALELDGVNLLSGASDEPLTAVIPELISAVWALLGEERVAQLSLPESQLELCLAREGSEVELSVVTLTRPARRLRRPVRVDLLDLKDAAVSSARTLEKDLLARAPRLAKTAPLRAMLKTASQLARTELAGSREKAGVPARAVVLERRAEAGHWFGFRLDDARGRLSAYRGRGGGALSSLLVPGELWLELGGRRVWSTQEAPVLVAMELSRLAEDLRHAIDARDKRFTLCLPGTGRGLALDLARGEVRVEGGALAAPAEELTRQLLELPIALTVAIAGSSRTQARNPYLEELTERCKRAVASGRIPSAPGPSAPAGRKVRKKAPSPPLPVAGRLKRLRFEPLWTKQPLGASGPGALLLGTQGPILHAPEMAAAFSRDGALLFRRVAAHGVAVTPEGLALCAHPDRVMLFDRARPSASWLRDHDGTPVGPALVRADGLLIASSEERGALAFCELTGRERWRFFPPRTQRAHLQVAGHRAILATDSGQLFGLDVEDGQLRYRVRAGVPFLGPVVPWGKALCAWVGRRDRLGLIRVDAHDGTVAWTVELPLSRPTLPLTAGARVYVAGEHEDDGAIACVSAKGELVWKRALHLGGGPYRLLQVGRSVLVSAQNGAATLLDSQGEVRWHLGAAGEVISCAAAPCLVRNVLVLPGAQVRAVDPERGEVLASVDAGATLCDLAVDRRLGLYLLDEHGALRAFRLRTQLGVVAPAPDPAA